MIKLFLIAGLGNPEEDYSNTRHNMGFDTINKLAKQYKIEVNKNKFKGLYGIGNIENQKVVLLKPQTFMNLSGESIKEAIDFYKIQKENIIIIYDDMDVKPGTIKIIKVIAKIAYKVLMMYEIDSILINIPYFFQYYISIENI